MLRTALIYKDAKIWAWKKINIISCPSFGLIRRPGHWELFFWIGSTNALSLKSGSTLPGRNCLLKFFWYWRMPLASMNYTSSTLNLSPTTMFLIHPLDQGGFKDLWRLITLSILWKGLSLLWKKIPSDRTSQQLGRITALKMPSLL